MASWMWQTLWPSARSASRTSLNLVALARTAVHALRDSREGDRRAQVHDFGPWVLRARPRGARALDGAIDGVNAARVVRGNT